ncbi:tRNA dimethylallyltransferase [Anopheles sinensis]|uniref:tRNA dimethylallyltransferase n=1 Tax=Anopheles sinensis TaxID=74873 RepID=A0A084VZF5_ANOSI|nr:tRNA dimethylallyltransferase [Anopheles sinensis]
MGNPKFGLDQDSNRSTGSLISWFCLFKSSKEWREAKKKRKTTKIRRDNPFASFNLDRRRTGNLRVRYVLAEFGTIADESAAKFHAEIESAEENRPVGREGNA